MMQGEAINRRTELDHIATDNTEREPKEVGPQFSVDTYHDRTEEGESDHCAVMAGE